MEILWTVNSLFTLMYIILFWSFKHLGLILYITFTCRLWPCITLYGAKRKTLKCRIYSSLQGKYKQWSTQVRKQQACSSGQWMILCVLPVCSSCLGLQLAQGAQSYAAVPPQPLLLVTSLLYNVGVTIQSNRCCADHQRQRSV